MLTIKNIADIKLKEFSFSGNEWILYGVDVSGIEYRFIFIPMEAGRYDISKAQLVLLNRSKHKRRGYRLWTTDGKHTYVNTNDIPLWTRFVEIVYKAKMIC